MRQDSTRCAACKYLRRRCAQDCVFAPYFPSSNPERFDCVHKIFGAGTVSKMLQQLPVHLRAEAAECMSYEAAKRIMDPVYGCARIISHLQNQIIQVQQELAKTEAEIAFHLARRQHQEQVVVHTDRGLLSHSHFEQKRITVRETYGPRS